MRRYVNVEMQENNTPERYTQAKPSRNLPLESLLQQAWLQSQRPNVQRPSTDYGSPVDVPLVVERPSSQSSVSQSPPPPLLSGADSGGPRDVEKSEEAYFHKTRPEALTADFLRRLAPPELNCFSQKVNIQKSSSLTLNRVKPTVCNGGSQDLVDSNSKFNSSSDEFSIATLPSLEDDLDAVDSEGLGDVFPEWTRETDAMVPSFLEELLKNEENLEGEISYMLCVGLHINSTPCSCFYLPKYSPR